MDIKTPYYIFDINKFSERLGLISEVLKDIPLVFSVKANPFILKGTLPKEITRVEVCSPGELSIVKRLNIKPSMIIYSGVMKEETDIAEAVEYGAGIFTAESKRHAMLIEQEASKRDVKIDVILRLSSGNQFGMSSFDIKDIISSKDEYPHLNIVGIHYYSGTGKSKAKKIEKDLANLRELLTALSEEFSYVPGIVEYGPGFASEFFNEPREEKDKNVLKELSPLLLEFAKEYPLSVEMGRFMASTCGEYHTKVCDLKTTEEVNYVILDGGMHHVNYYGQMMAMYKPPVKVISKGEGSSVYTVCGSLCTTADVLLRDFECKTLSVGDELIFEKAGAYSCMEAPALFLSRKMPQIWLKENEEYTLVRDTICADEINVPL